MRTVVVTDAKYRSSIAAARTLGRAGWTVIAAQARGDCPLEPPVFASKYVSGGRWIEGSASDPDYPDHLLALLGEYGRPVLFPAGAATLNAVSRQRERFGQACDFLIAPPDVLDALNDKETVHRRCVELGIPVPAQYDGPPERYPVIVKPRCGEKFGLKARDRYAVANSPAEYEKHMAAMTKYDPHPIVQEKMEGDGMGASLLLDREGRLICALCHRRLREYPASGGPSTCCASIYDEKMIESAYRLLSSFGFVGMAMVEFKGDRVLEVNPRVWGSFPMTQAAGSPFAALYARAAAGERVDYTPCDYKVGAKLRFTLNDGAAALDYLRHGQPGQFFRAAGDFFAVGDGLADKEDPAPFRRYLRQALLRR